MSQNSVRNIWKSILNKSGLDHRPLHMLRHFFASHLLSENMPLKKVQKLMGHANASMTLDIYSEYMPKKNDLSTSDCFNCSVTNGSQNKKALKIVNDNKDLGAWWRCRDLNPGHHGYEPCALTS